MTWSGLIAVHLHKCIVHTSCNLICQYQSSAALAFQFSSSCSCMWQGIRANSCAVATTCPRKSHLKHGPDRISTQAPVVMPQPFLPLVQGNRSAPDILKDCALPQHTPGRLVPFCDVQLGQNVAKMLQRCWHLGAAEIPAAV